ncbi:FAD-dependent oxidoreductase [Aureimonas altamirensis]|uniref:NAD(P)/FAD-dependent oxidoreductase n=1 Tax=Aureimonas altamirensis TaxID=370622 RepID=UPI001E3C2E94|nr:FAD-dependent oxidoreductase [Aureimonas altamirensis]UHD44646.1 FAD-dependent oxidoreductase [Aureimonas altamirensis]
MERASGIERRIMSPVNQETADVVVIGAGVVGLMAGRALRAEGRQVLVLDKSGPASGASAGNAGILAFPEILPLASPGILRQAPRWLADPLGPLAIRPAYALRIAPWLLRFAAASRPVRHDEILAAQATIMRLAEMEMQRVLQEPALALHARTTGTLDLYDGASAFDAARGDWAAKEKAGFAFKVIGGDEIEALQPGLHPRFRQKAVYNEDGRHIIDPRLFTLALAQRLEAEGGALRRDEVLKVEPAEAGAVLTLPGNRRLSARTVVVAAGAWSKQLAGWLGDTVPLETERGYNTTLPAGAFDLRRQLYFNGHGFVATPIGGGVRIGGAVELGGLNLPPNWKRSDAMLAKAAQFLPGLRTEGGTRWMGFRPSMPDTLAVIGYSAAGRHIIHAFGHGHLGLTQSAATARLVAELAAGRAPSIDLAPFSPRRFKQTR